MADDKPIIIIKKKGGHGGHHGGAWKVAYADFVTAMMAFFMVMWLLNSASTPVKQSIASYFRKPGLFQEGSGTPLMMGEAGILRDAYVPPSPDKKKYSSGAVQAPNKKQSGPEEQHDHHDSSPKQAEEPPTDAIPAVNRQRGAESEKPDKKPLDIDKTSRGYEFDKPTVSTKEEEIAKRNLQQAAEELRTLLQMNPRIKELLGIVDVKIENDGLQLDIMDTERSSMFSSGSAKVLPEAQEAFTKIGGILAKLPNTIDVMGHTDGKPFSSRQGGYSNWELSADRANAARRLLENAGIEAARFTSVVGKADKDLKNIEDPLAPANRRITVKVRFKASTAINVDKEPDVLEDLFKPTAIPTTAPTMAATDTETSAIEPEASPTQLSAKEIVESTKEKKSVALPEQRDPIDSNPTYIEKD